jgi:hypothetical protein
MHPKENLVLHRSQADLPGYSVLGSEVFIIDFVVNTLFWHARWDRSQAPMTKNDIHPDNVIRTTMEDLSEEHKQEVNQKVELYREACLYCFATRR